MRASLFVVAIVLCGACAGDSTDIFPAPKTYTGPFSTQVTESTVTVSLLGGGTFPCTNTYTMAGTVTVTIDSISGQAIEFAQVNGTQIETAFGGGTSCKPKGNLAIGWAPKLMGTAGDLHFSDQLVTPNGGYVVTSRTSFAGALSGGVVTGALTFSVVGAGTIGTGSVTQNYSVTTNVALR